MTGGRKGADNPTAPSPAEHKVETNVLSQAVNILFYNCPKSDQAESKERRSNHRPSHKLLQGVKTDHESLLNFGVGAAVMTGSGIFARLSSLFDELPLHKGDGGSVVPTQGSR